MITVVFERIVSLHALRTQFLLRYHLRETETCCGLVQGLYNDGSVRENWMSDGFLGLNAEFASFLYAYGQRTGDPEAQRIARRIAEFFTTQQLENGLFYSNYYLKHACWDYQFGCSLCFTRPMGERLWSLVELASQLPGDDPLRERILAFCRRSVEFFLRSQLPNGSFGKTWANDGRLVEDSGANFSYITWFLCRLHRLEPNPAYLAVLERTRREFPGALRWMQTENPTMTGPDLTGEEVKIAV